MFSVRRFECLAPIMQKMDVMSAGEDILQIKSTILLSFLVTIGNGYFLTREGLWHMEDCAGEY